VTVALHIPVKIAQNLIQFVYLLVSHLHCFDCFSYEHALSYIKGATDFTEEQQTAANVTALACNLNSAMCHLKSKQPREAISACDKALEIDAANVKALFRRGTALNDVGEWDQAIQDFTRALEIDASNKDAKDALARVVAAKQEYASKERKLYAKMFQ
jgi:FK506-binding protein 4/5